MGGTNRVIFFQYGVATLAVALAVLLRLLLSPLLHERLPLITLFAAVVFVAWYGGKWPACFALLLGLIAVTIFVLEPQRSIRIAHQEDVFGLVFYAVIGAGSIALFDQLRTSQLAAAQDRERLSVTLASIGDGVITTDAQGRITFLNGVAQQLTGWTQQEAEGMPLEKIFVIVNETTRQPVENPALRSLREGEIVGLANHTILIAKSGAERPIDDSAAPIRDYQGRLFGSVLVFRDITERKQAEAALNERVRLLSLNAAVGKSLVQGNGPGTMLQQCSEALVKHLDGAFARIWTLNETEGVLELRASAGMYTHLDGPHSRVPVGKYKIGLIAQERRPHLTNAVVGDPRVSDPAWAKREGMIAFAGYPLVVDDSLVGVMAMFARQPLSEATLAAMASVADEIAVGIERKATQDRLHAQQEWLRITLASIGDAMIATDTQGRVTFLNGVAADLTGWKPEEAHGQPLETVFPIRNEQTGQSVENPVEKVLREGAIVGLANHTILVAKDGIERPIDDSAAPIRDGSGQMIGVVLIFRDVTEQRRGEEKLRASEARKSAILETALDCVITMDHHGKVVEFNPAAERTFGYSRGEVVGRELADLIIPPSLRERHHRGMAHYLATGEGPVLGKRLELPAQRADGSEFPVELAITRIPTDGPPLFTAYLRDISDRTRAEQHRSARLAVTYALAQAATAEEGIDGVLQAVGESLAWDVGFCWMVSGDGKTLVCRRSWHRADVPMNGFEANSFGRTFNHGEGLPGHVWSTGQPRWLLDVAHDTQFPRAASAAEYGLHSAFACPIKVGDRTLGVIEFFTKRLREPDADLLEMMGTVAGNVGQFIERKTAEEGLREQTLIAQTLNQIGTILAAELDLDTIVQAVTDEGTALSGAEFGAFFYNVPDEQGGSYLLYSLSGVPREAFAQFPLPRNTAIFSPTFRGEGTVRLDDVTKDPRFGKNAPYHGMPEGHLPVKSYLAVPVVSRSGEVLGGLFFGHSQVGVFTERHERIMVGVAAQAAIAIDNARLYQQTQDSEERFRQLAEHIQDVFWMADPHKPQMLYVSPAYERIWGRSRQSLYDQPRAFLDAIHSQDRERVMASLQRQAQGETTSEEYRVVRLDGSVRWVWDRAFPIRDAGGRVYRVAGIAEDIDERKHAEDASRFLADASTVLATVEDYRSTLQKVAGLAVPTFADWCAVDLVEESSFLQRLAVVHVDAEKVRLVTDLYYRYPPDPEQAHGPYRVLRTGEPEFVAEIGDDVLKAVATNEEHLRILRGLGLRSFICVPLTTRSRILGVVTFAYAESGRRYEARDLSLAAELARRAAVAIENAGLYHALKEADRRKDEFLATLAHELRNPLAPIRNGLQVLRLAGGGGETGEQARSMMERQLGQMVRLVDDLLDVSRITRNKLELRKERVALGTVVHSAVETSRPLMEQFGHTFSLTLPPDPVYLDADLTRLAQVFSNLLNNAAKYTEPGGTISLIGEVVEDQVAVRVRDNGLGIPAEAIPRLFQMFSQVDGNMERAQGGLGIGLTLVRRLAEMHGGSVEAHSEGPGRGSEFVVWLPVVKLDRLSSPIPDSDQRPAAASLNRRILIVDDNYDSATSLGMMLKLMGNETRTAHDGLAAIDAAEQFRPDLILLDIGLPKLNGYDVCRRIREQHWSNGMVIVALTGWGQEEDRRRSQEAGFDYHLVKPVELTALQTLLSER